MKWSVGRFKINAGGCCFTLSIIISQPLDSVEAKYIHEAKTQLDKLSNPALEVTKLLIPRACNDIAGSSTLLISYSKPLSTFLCFCFCWSLCLRQGKLLRFILGVSSEKLRSHKIWSSLGNASESFFFVISSMRYSACTKLVCCPTFQSYPELHQVIVGVLVTPSELPSLQSTSVEQGGIETSFLPHTPALAWLWQAGPCAFQTSSGWLRGFAMGYETLCLEATCLAPAVGTLLWRLSGGPSSGLHEKSWKFWFRWKSVAYFSKALSILMRHLGQKKTLHFHTDFLTAWGVDGNWQTILYIKIISHTRPSALRWSDSSS